jgi:hypothetical protein
MQRRPFRGLLALVNVLHCLERASGTGLLLPRFFLLRRHVPPPSHHSRDAFLRVFLFLAFCLDRFRLRFELHARGKTAAAQAVHDLDRYTMSDHIDNTDKILFAEVARGLAAVRSRSALVAHDCCHHCDEALVPALLFCGVDCRDD